MILLQKFGAEGGIAFRPNWRTKVSFSLKWLQNERFFHFLQNIVEAVIKLIYSVRLREVESVNCIRVIIEKLQVLSDNWFELIQLLKVIFLLSETTYNSAQKQFILLKLATFKLYRF